MRVKSSGLTIATLVVILMVLTPVAHATFDWSGTSINSGYAVTTDWHGELVPLGEEVTAWAGTTDASVVEVKFRWMKPDGADWLDYGYDEGWEEWPAGSGQMVHEWTSSVTPIDPSTDIGDWGVQAVFYDTEGHGIGPIPEQPYPVAIRARSFFAVPEVAIGTIAVVVAMFGALGFFALKRKHVSIKKHL